jgi:1-acyl-sn-glycerol-3-phosphate acyltransferase
VSYVRGTLNLLAFSFLTAGVGVALAFVPLLRLVRMRRAASRTSVLVFRIWARGSLRILKARVEVRGPLPEAPFFLVTNHLGYVDVMVLASVLDCVFVSRADVAGWPIVGPLVRVVGTVFIDREAKRDIPRVLARIEDNLAHGRGIVLFPEGTSSKGETVLPFRAPLLEVAARSGLQVSYAALTYRTKPRNPPAHLAVCWWGDMAFGSHLVRLFRLSGFDATVRFGERTLKRPDRKDLAQQSWEGVLGLFEPVVPASKYNGPPASIAGSIPTTDP